MSHHLAEWQRACEESLRRSQRRRATKPLRHRQQRFLEWIFALTGALLVGAVVAVWLVEAGKI